MALKTSLSSGNRRTQTKAAAMLLLILMLLLALILALLPQPARAARLQTPAIPFVHVVRPGDTLAGIAMLYGVPVQDLRAANNIDNRAAVVSCHPNADSTQVRGTVRVDGRPAGGYRVAVSWQPDGNAVVVTSTGAGGGFNFVLGGGAREGNWWFWVENEAGSRVSEMAHLETHRDPHYGKCQRAVVDFELRNPNVIYIGRALLIPVDGHTIASFPRPPAYHTYHVARRGETLAAIASLYNIPVEELKDSNGLFNRAAVVGCEPNADSTQVRGTVRVNGQPAGGYRVAFSWQPDGDAVATRVTGEEAAPGEYVHVLDGGGPRPGNWWFWVENNDAKRISEMAHLHTDGRPHAGMCQRAVIDFDIRNPALTYVGRRLRITAGGGGTNAWTAAFYPNRELRGEPVLQRQDPFIEFDWHAGRPGPTVAGDNFSAAWTTTRHFEAGAYRFFARADDGVRVYVDDRLVLEDWKIHPATRSFGDVNLGRGNHTVRVEYFEAGGLAAVSVWWERRR